MEPTLGFAMIKVGLLLLVVPAAMLAATRCSGYDRLCGKFPVHRPFKGPWLRAQTMKFGKYFNLSQCMDIGFDADSMYVRFMPCYWPFGKQMQIPWSQVESVEEHSAGIFSTLKFQITSGETITFQHNRSLRDTLTTQLPKLGLNRLIG
jgi:hypothetical protein